VWGAQYHRLGRGGEEKFAEGHELLEGKLLESMFVDMDPVIDRFAGDLVE
jgi:hypothetical protein